MKRLGIGEICRLLDIKPHILRYWEAEIPLLDPPKDTGGRRVYGDRELNLLYRLRYLIQEKRYTVEGAKLALLDELAGGREDEKALVGAVRSRLLEVWESTQRLRARKLRFTEKSLFPPGQGHLRRIWELLPPQGRENLIAGLLELTPGRILQAGRLAGRADRQTPPPLEMRVYPRGRGHPRDYAAAGAALARGRVGLVTLLPDGIPAAEALPALEGLAAAVREAACNCGTTPPWFIFAGGSLHSPVRSLVRGRGRFLFDSPRVEVLGVPDFPFFDSRGRLLVGPDGSPAVYSSVAAGAFWELCDREGPGRKLDESGVHTLAFLPLNRFSRAFPHRDLLAGHYGRGARVSALLYPGPDGPMTTGIYIVRRDLFRNGEEAIPLGAEAVRIQALMPGVRTADDITDVPTERIFSRPSFLAGAGIASHGARDGAVVGGTGASAPPVPAGGADAATGKAEVPAGGAETPAGEKDARGGGTRVPADEADATTGAAGVGAGTSGGRAGAPGRGAGSETAADGVGDAGPAQSGDLWGLLEDR